MGLLARGHSARAVARTLRCAPSSVTRWQRAYRARGRAALRVTRSQGRSPRLSAAEVRSLRALLEAGPRASGLPGDSWTAARACFLIESRFGERYHPRHVARLLRRFSH